MDVWVLIFVQVVGVGDGRVRGRAKGKEKVSGEDEQRAGGWLLHASNKQML